MMGAARFAAFRADVAERGVLVPLEIDPAGVVLDGRERLRAAIECGLAEVPVRVVQVADPVRHMLLAALQRRDLEKSQRAALCVELADYDAARATRNRHELLLFGRKGNYPVTGPDERVDSVIEADAGRHSAKPDCVYGLIEHGYPLASKLELFRRGAPWPGWQAWGNQVTE